MRKLVVQFSFFSFISGVFILIIANHIGSFHFIVQGAYLINVARGGLLDYDAVAQGLQSGHLGGLGIDVAWTEPFDPKDPILQHPNVLITPHVAGVTESSYRAMSKVYELIF